MLGCWSEINCLLIGVQGWNKVAGFICRKLLDLYDLIVCAFGINGIFLHKNSPYANLRFTQGLPVSGCTQSGSINNHSLLPSIILYCSCGAGLLSGLEIIGNNRKQYNATKIVLYSSSISQAGDD